jgi:signal transduction histidine kinase
VKYSPPGAEVWVSGASDGSGGAVIAVRDEGVGIPQDELAKLFGRFFRASTSAGVPGSGIGLHLAKHLAEMHGGRIEVVSVLGEGTTFTVYLPARPPAHRTAATVGPGLPATA